MTFASHIGVSFVALLLATACAYGPTPRAQGAPQRPAPIEHASSPPAPRFSPLEARWPPYAPIERRAAEPPPPPRSHERGDLWTMARAHEAAELAREAAAWRAREREPRPAPTDGCIIMPSRSGHRYVPVVRSRSAAPREARPEANPAVLEEVDDALEVLPRPPTRSDRAPAPPAQPTEGGQCTVTPCWDAPL